MDNPCSDHLFSPQKNIKKHSGGGWEITGEVRMGVLTPISGNSSSQKQWRDVEMTGYVYVIDKFHSDYGSHFSFYGRGGSHTACSGSGLECCDGSSYKVDLDVDKPGEVYTKKEISHPHYASSKGDHQTGATMMHKWVGWKGIIFNRANNSVVIQGYIDKNGDNNWVSAFTVYDNSSSHWAASGGHKGCTNFITGKTRENDDVIAWSGPHVTFRSDGLTWAFKDLSVREICALGSQADCAKIDHRADGCHNMKEGSGCASAKCHIGEHEPFVPTPGGC
jgi:hypothetical protein